MNININFPKIKFQNIINALKAHIILIWSVLGVILFIWAGYIFYSKSYAPTYTIITPIIQQQTVQKNKLEAILKDLSEREQAMNEFSREKIISPFEFRLTQ